jgi:hypothetical protein
MVGFPSLPSTYNYSSIGVLTLRKKCVKTCKSSKDEWKRKFFGLRAKKAKKNVG